MKMDKARLRLWRASKQPVLPFVILTEPIPVSNKWLSAKTIEAIIYTTKHIFLGNKLGGHYGVTRSLLSGLIQNEVTFHYNVPIWPHQKAENVLVLSGDRTLRRLLRAKKAGKIDHLAAGPNIVVLPTEGSGCLLDEALDVVIVPSAWVKQCYEQIAPQLKGKIDIWAAGINADYWSPLQTNGDKMVTVYQKGAPENLVSEVISAVQKAGYQSEIIKYGEYQASEYKQLLGASAFAVFLSASESQGLALAEAWSMNVPTLVWEPGVATYNNFVFNPVSAAPYLEEEAGATWKTTEELVTKLQQDKLKALIGKKPRELVLSKFIDKNAAKDLISKLVKRGFTL